MSVLNYSETLNSKEVQIWDNAAFDNGDSEGSTKENRTPSMEGSPVSVKSLAAPINPLELNTSITNIQQSNPVSGAGFSGKKKGDDLDLDSEIEEIEKEMNRLSLRLENLRLEKAKRNAKAVEKRGRVIAAKFMDPLKQSIKNFEELSKIEDLSAKSRTPSRGLSMGPMEIMRGARRGISLGPAEIYSAMKLKQLSTPSSTRRQSCYWKLQNIDELKVTRERGKNSSLSPKSRLKMVSKSLLPKQPATTIGCKKTVKKEDGLIASIQPKKLFTKDGEKSQSPIAKKPMKCGSRLVPSRYSQVSNEGNSAMKEVRKRSWPESEQHSSISRENRVKKRWEIPSEVLQIKISPTDNDNDTEEGEEENVCQGLDFTEEVSPTKKECLRIRILRCVNESPRDSGAAKRVAELVGKKSFFDNDDDHEMPVFNFEDGEES